RRPHQQEDVERGPSLLHRAPDAEGRSAVQEGGGGPQEASRQTARERSGPGARGRPVRAEIAFFKTSYRQQEAKSQEIMAKESKSRWKSGPPRTRDQLQTYIPYLFNRL